MRWIGLSLVQLRQDGGIERVRGDVLLRVLEVEQRIQVVLVLLVELRLRLQ